MQSDNTEKRAPVQGYPGGIPWAIYLEAYEVYCKRYGAQPALIDLEGRGCRGGFGTGELDDFIPGWRDRVSEFGKLKTEVLALRAEVAALKAAAQGLPTWWTAFIQNVGELDGRNSPEDEPDAMVATADELERCALSAIECGA